VSVGSHVDLSGDWISVLELAVREATDREVRGLVELLGVLSILFIGGLVQGALGGDIIVSMRQGNFVHDEHKINSFFPRDGTEFAGR
jgi:hypothetical protein